MKINLSAILGVPGALRSWPEVMGDLERLLGVGTINPCGICTKSIGCNQEKTANDSPKEIKCGFDVDIEGVNLLTIAATVTPQSLKG